MARGGSQAPRIGLLFSRNARKEGKRDEHGMEDVDGLFSSPEKSSADLNGYESEDSIGSDGMSIDEGNAPEPQDYLNGNSVSRSSLLPSTDRFPKGRSQLTRRSPVVHSSPEPEGDLLSSPSDDRELTRSSRQEPSPLTARSINAGVSKQKSAQRTKVQEEPTTLPEFSDGEGDENANSFLPGDDQDDSFGAGEETVMHDEDVPETNGQDQSDAESDLSQSTELEPEPEPAPAPQASSSKTKKGPAKTQKSEKPAKGRPGKKPRTQDEEEVEARPPKKQKTSKAQPVEQEPLDPELNKVVEDYAQRSGPLKGRSLYILKRENPADPSSTHTRSGRASIRPLAYWRNERCVYGDPEVADGERYPLSTIKEIVRTEELEPDRKKKGKRAARPGKGKKRRAEESSDEDEEADGWEKEGGVLHGYIPRWDPKSQTSTKEEDVIDIAYAPSGIETREVKDSTFRFAKLLSSSFIGSGVVELPPEGVKRPKNSKKMHMVFYVCHGRVQVDISGVQFSAGKGCVFQVPRGRSKSTTLKLWSPTDKYITGNYYSFQNAHKKEARLFFTQGCVPGEGEEIATKSKPAVQDSEFEGEGEAESEESSSKATKARGRPKGKQKAK
ncbi:uncharacterized protein N7483_007875 [Penicillium malachiteum]|uniref:uncharacterized protein n=1 Tax=Penicillium malachiteum TaxID=1324776 RepID=UPI002549BECC|nr:uncharacterized protein N7483_007875 [Penicillium malachiteum]KAJ5726518.1 hypothetical protein N7483_007875 [Penicillium malachiteum]